MADEKKDRAAIKKLVRAYFAEHKQPVPFEPGATPIPCGGRVFDADEMENLVGAALDFWLTAGPETEAFEARCADLVGVDHAFFVNSGSSALLLAVTALFDRTLGARRLERGDEVITPAMGFPTTVAPIVMAGAVPVFVDVELPYYNPSAAAVRAALTDRTRAIVLAHAMGNPFDAEGIGALAREHSLWVVEDNCDALGSLHGGILTGAFGHLSTLSFYASHNLTTGEGGAVLTGSEELAEIVRSLRDWGRDCVCAPGRDNTCGERFTRQHGSLPLGYDHKYVCARLGFNLKATDLQAAVGLAQLDKLAAFSALRRKNFARIKDALSGMEKKIVLPAATPGSDPSWFGFPVTLGPACSKPRIEVVRFLEDRRIATRMLFAGNLARHPAFEGINHRVAGSLETTDRIMNDSFWVGCYSAITDAMCDFMAESIIEAVV